MSRGSRFINISSLLLMNSLLVYLLTDTREHLSFLYCPRGPHWKTDVLGYKGVLPCNTSPLLSPFPFIILPYCLFPFHYSALLSVSSSFPQLIVSPLETTQLYVIVSLPFRGCALLSSVQITVLCC